MVCLRGARRQRLRLGGCEGVGLGVRGEGLDGVKGEGGWGDGKGGGGITAFSLLVYFGFWEPSLVCLGDCRSLL